MKGRRAEDYDSFWADPPGVWWKWEDVSLGDDGPLVTRWLIRPPCGHHFMLASGRPAHEVEEHEDGAVTVEPKPGNSNSILCRCGWHGYVKHGDWQLA